MSVLIPGYFLFNFSMNLIVYSVESVGFPFKSYGIPTRNKSTLFSFIYLNIKSNISAELKVSIGVDIILKLSVTATPILFRP